MTGRFGILCLFSLILSGTLLFFNLGIAQGAGSVSGRLAKSGAAHKSTLSELPQISRFERLSGNFQQVKFLRELDVKIQTSGQFQINRSDSENSVVHWNLERPKKSQICIDREGLVIDSMNGSVSSKRRLNFSEVGQEAGDQIVSLTKLITMDFRVAEKDFRIEKKGKTFILKPNESKGAFFESAKLELTPEGYLKNIEIKEKSQDEIQIQFSDFKVSQSLKGEKCTL